jgi:large subunit ribosomal protein L29
MKASDLRAKDAGALQEELVALLKEQFSLRMQLATQQLANSAQLGRVRKDIARVRTVMREKAVA